MRRDWALLLRVSNTDQMIRVDDSVIRKDASTVSDLVVGLLSLLITIIIVETVTMTGTAT